MAVKSFDLHDILGLHYFAAEKFKPFQFITYMFMHGSFTHIFFNMFALWMFGKTIENVWGTKKFLIYYFVTGVGAALVHYGVMYFEFMPAVSAINGLIDAPSIQGFIEFRNSSAFKLYDNDMVYNYNQFAGNLNQLIHNDERAALQSIVAYLSEYKMDLYNAPVVVGASGAVFGLLLAFGMLFPNSTIYIYFAIPMKAKYFVMLYGAAELFSGIFNSHSNVAHFAHLGGMIFGFILIKMWKRNNYRQY
ncbi:MAG: rhomboid family intramembrane serine protease [Bacteroidales bacterium]|nr:rhomboid family intramembrane serine protease [Bacteroidales bacterium]